MKPTAILSLLLAIVFATATEACKNGPKEDSAAMVQRAQEAELAACKRAGLVTPNWRPCGSGFECFQCADQYGRLIAVMAPACNTKGKSKTWTKQCDLTATANKKS